MVIDTYIYKFDSNVLRDIAKVAYIFLIAFLHILEKRVIKFSSRHAHTYFSILDKNLVIAFHKQRSMYFLHISDECVFFSRTMITLSQI